MEGEELCPGLKMIPCREVLGKSSVFSDENGNYFMLSYNDDITNMVFRKGGIFKGFKDNNYCELLCYPSVKDSLGFSCIIDRKGKIVFKCDSILKYVYFLKGVIAICNKIIINLESNMQIEEYANYISSDKYIFVPVYENNKKFVYCINFETGTFSKYD